VEPNSPESAANGPLCWGNVYHGLPNDAWDYFSVLLDYPGMLTVDLTGYNPFGNGYLILYDPSGSPVASSGSIPYHIAYNASQKGLYHLGIYTVGFSEDPYTLQAIFPTPTFLPVLSKNINGCMIGTAEVEPNNIASEANGPLCLNVAYQGIPADEWDIYYVTLPSAGVLTIDLTAYTAASGSFLGLYASDSTLTLLEGKTSAPFHLARAVASGKYYIAVHSVNGSISSTPYQLKVNWP